MPVTYSIDADRRMIRTTCSGKVAFQEVIDHLRALERDPACPDRVNVLLDLSATETLPESRQVTAVSAELGRTGMIVRFDACAIVASSDALFGMMRMFEVMAQEHFRASRVFRSTAEAEAWLMSQRTIANHA